MSRSNETSQPDRFGETEREHSPVELSAYFLELERLLDRVESSTTHYQVLSLDRSAPREQVDRSYQEMLRLIYPEYGVAAAVPPDVAARVDRAFMRSSVAFSILASFARRREYDRTLLSQPEKLQDATKPARPQISSRAEGSAVKAPPRGQADVSEISISHLPARPGVFSDFSKGASRDNRRRCERIRLSIPARATGFERKGGKWHEMTETVDVSRTGLTLRMRRRLRHGNVLYLTLPLPTKLRSHGYSDPHYNVYALVRRVEPARLGVREIGLEFLGEHPPTGFLEKPWAVFRTKKWNGIERRRAPRVNRSEIVRIEYFSESMQLIASEEARTENVSRSGLRIAVKAAPVEFDLVRVNCNRYGFEALAAVRNRSVSKDGVERLCVQFIEKEWPL